MKMRQEMRLQGLPVSKGVAIGKVCLFNEWRHFGAQEGKIDALAVPSERGRLEHALRTASSHVASLVEKATERLGAEHATIFAAQQMMIEDQVLHAQMFELIETGHLNAEAAVITSFDSYEAVLANMAQDYFRERASDIGEVKRRVLGVLHNSAGSFQCTGGENCRRGRSRIIIADELTPSLTMLLDAEHVLGFATEHGGVASHAAILAKALGIPAVSGIHGIHGLISCGTEVLVDGDNGTLVVWPRESTLDEYPLISRSVSAYGEAVGPVCGLRVLANISRPAEVERARRMEAEGIGLYRTEFAFIAGDRALSEDEQFEQYSSVVRAMDGRTVTFRLLDIGADKAAPFLNVPHEENPQLGLRGSRLLLARPELLGAQARALVRASKFGPIDILYPMIADVDQFVAIRRRFLEAVAGLESGQIRHGAMFEIPAACICARQVFAEADFGSIGTNDLTQYLFAVDRDNELVAGEYNPDRPAFWALMETVSRAAREANRSLSVCGEMAGNPAYTARFMDLGISTVSVSPRLIPEVRRAAVSRTSFPSGEFI